MSGAVLVTRHPADCTELQQLVQPRGLTIRPYPVLRIEELDDGAAWGRVASLLADAGDRPWLAFASPRAPARTARLAARHHAGALAECPVAAVGEATAAAASDAGFTVELVGPGSGAGLGSMLAESLPPGTSVVLACGRDRRPELGDALESSGHPVLPLVVYAMVPTPPRELPPLGGGLEAVVLTSPRAARLYLESVGGRPLPLQHWALGATTRDAAAALGIQCRIPARPTITSLAEELCRI
jgi:uroporphyrinogen-III synthase